MTTVYLRLAPQPVDYVQWDGENFAEIAAYVDPDNNSWHPSQSGTDLILTGSKPSPFQSAPQYTIPQGTFIHAEAPGQGARSVTMLAPDAVGWTYEVAPDAAPSTSAPTTIAF